MISLMFLIVKKKYSELSYKKEQICIIFDTFQKRNHIFCWKRSIYGESRVHPLKNSSEDESFSEACTESGMFEKMGRTLKPHTEYDRKDAEIKTFIIFI